MSLSSTDIAFADRYRLQERIAEGGMGEVWRAFDQVLQRPVAIKVMRSGYGGHAETLARFRAEARHAAALSHPGIAQVYDYGDGGPGEPPFLVMELIDGPALTQLLARGPLEPVLVLDIIAQAAAGLAAAHAAGLVHRDIKPGNLLIGPGGVLKITDFGIAYATGAAPLTRTGMLMGTPAYIAPERVAGLPATPASDLYALGIVGYECLTGTVPFTGTPFEVALAHQNSGLPPLPRWVPWQLADLVTELTARDPAARPASAAEVAARARRIEDELAADGLAGATGGWLPVPDSGLGGQTYASGAWQSALAATAADPLAASTPGHRTLAEMSTSSAGYGAPEPDGTWPGGGRPRSAVGRHPFLFATLLLLVIIGVAGWMMYASSGSGPRSGQRPTAGTTRRTTTTATAHEVKVNRAALLGRSVRVVVPYLRRLGLQVQVTWVRNPADFPGTVTWVGATGDVPIGSTVVVTATISHQHGHGNHGNGNGNGGGGDGNGDGGG
jgi:serine/threonine protein kinase